MSNKRSLPTPRNEGMANIVAATIRLLETATPQEITLRDVARESGHGHRLIVEWFGGKGGLFSAVFNEIFRQLTSTGELFVASISLRTEVRTAFQMFNYMQIHHREFVERERTGFVLQALQERVAQNLSVSSEKASLIARRMAVLNIGLALFSEYFNLTDEEIIQMAQDEFKSMTGLNLPAYPPQPSAD